MHTMCVLSCQETKKFGPHFLKSGPPRVGSIPCIEFLTLFFLPTYLNDLQHFIDVIMSPNQYIRVQKSPKESKWVQMSPNESNWLKAVARDVLPWAMFLNYICLWLSFASLKLMAKWVERQGGLDCRAFYCHNSSGRGRHGQLQQEGGGSLSSRHCPAWLFAQLADQVKLLKWSYFPAASINCRRHSLFFVGGGSKITG